MAPFLRRPALAGGRADGRPDAHHRRRYPAAVTAVAQVPSRPGERLADLGRRERRGLEPHRPGASASRSTSGAGRRRPAHGRLRRQRLGRLNLGPDEPGPHRPRRPPTWTGCAPRTATRPVPVDLVTTSGSGPRPGHQPGRRRVPGRARRTARGHGEAEVRADVARHTEQPLLGFLGQPRVTSWRSTSTSTGCLRMTTGARRVRHPPHGGGDAGPDPAESEPAGRGRLRVYLGMAPGVGKTYRMLEEGHRRTRPRHRRGRRLRRAARPAADTAALLDGLEIVPRRRIDYRGVVVEEMDTDAVIARRPTVALDRRAGPHERPGLGPREALAGRGGHPRRRHPRREHLQRPAPRIASPTPSRRSPARPSTSASRRGPALAPTRSSWST